MLDRDFEQRMHLTASRPKWAKVHDPDRRTDYFEMPVRLGSLKLWLTAEEDRWLVETGEGTVVMSGSSTGYQESCRQALRAVLGAVTQTRESLLPLVGEP